MVRYLYPSPPNIYFLKGILWFKFQLIALQDVICVRGYWNLPENLSKDDILNWFMDKIKKRGLSDVDETLYFSQGTGEL